MILFLPWSLQAGVKEVAASSAPDTCYVMGGEDLDGRTLDLRDALQEVVGRNIGTVLSCIPGKLAYYEGENEGERYILER